jgi:hypothetical protein
MRMGYGELRALEAANAHWFRADEVVDLAAFIVPCLVYGWDAYIVPANAGASHSSAMTSFGVWQRATRKHMRECRKN